ncbi:MAG: hypothetical protein JO020_34555 [Chloroflexi bacterium]|nr:hypothetical protein [Chloroflexota bacterium]MBV9899307.1 hypothetical protein [Chloroflexota bacterium]
MPAPKQVHILGKESFDPDEFFTITYHFTPRHIDVVQGQTVTWDNQTTDAHTISVLAPSDVPKTVDQVNNCAICNQIQADHFPNGFPPQGQPVLFLDNFNAGNLPARFDSVGDSLLTPPPGLGLPLSVSASITAPVGIELHYICAFHPWDAGDHPRGQRA